MQRLRDALDRDLAVELDVVAVDPDVGGLERNVRVALGIEEVRRLQMRCQVLVLYLDRADRNRAGELAVLELRVDLFEAAAEGGHEVLDAEVGAGVNGGEVPGAGEALLSCGGVGGAH